MNINYNERRDRSDSRNQRENFTVLIGLMTEEYTTLGFDGAIGRVVGHSMC